MPNNQPSHAHQSADLFGAQVLKSFAEHQRHILQAHPHAPASGEAVVRNILSFCKAASLFIDAAQKAATVEPAAPSLVIPTVDRTLRDAFAQMGVIMNWVSTGTPALDAKGRDAVEQTLIKFRQREAANHNQHKKYG